MARTHRRALSPQLTSLGDSKKQSMLEPLLLGFWNKFYNLGKMDTFTFLVLNTESILLRTGLMKMKFMKTVLTKRGDI